MVFVAIKYRSNFFRCKRKLELIDHTVGVLVSKYNNRIF